MHVLVRFQKKFSGRKGKDFSILRIFSQILENTFDRLNAENALRANQELLSAIFEAVAEGIIAINSEGRITQINARFIYMWRVPDEIVEKSDFEILMEEVADQLKDSKIFIDKAQSLRKTSKTDFNMIICKDGRIFDQYSRPITLEGKIIGRLWSFRDVTEHQNAEQELRKSEKLYRDAYERANFYKDIFTHDMNNIFHNIQFSAELISMLKDNVNKIGTPEDLFTTIIHQIDRGSKLIENVRKLSKLEESKVSLQNLEIYEFLENAILFAKKSVRDKKIEIKIKRTKENVFVEANEFLLDVFENILHNATKYNKNPIISVQIIISKEDKYGIKFIKMEFLDNGIGIDDKSKKLIFLKGYKKDKNIRGMGIGLSLVKKIIESFNGKIWVENRIQDDYTLGSNFVVEIPELN
ncbi:MAG TPA: PAS domain-containing sensor histidine kinase [archaeon]|nr:PAS domain-containing sensor histidine kinase [archaeon]